MTPREAIVDEARSWKGTPFKPQHATKGVGCDCAGLLKGVALARGLLPADYARREEYREIVAYLQTAKGDSLKRLCDRILRPVPRDRMQPGDAVLVRPGRNPQHLGIVTPHPSGGLAIVHAASTGDGQGRVVEHHLMFHERLRFVAAYAFPGVDDG